jgi:hypothetical protein
VTGYTLGNSSQYDFVTIKYSLEGIGLWTNYYNGPGNNFDQPTAMRVDAAGNVYVTGPSIGFFTATDFATIKYSSTGVGLWTNRYSSTNFKRRRRASGRLGVKPGGKRRHCGGHFRQRRHGRRLRHHPVQQRRQWVVDQSL